VREEADAKGKKRKVASTEPRPDFRTVPDEAAAATMNKNGRTPNTTEDGYDVNCTCDILVARELERYYAVEAATKAKEPISKPNAEKPAVSLQDYLGRASAGKFIGIDETKLAGLLVIFRELDQAELAALDRAVNTDYEFRGLFLAKNAADMKRMITLAKDREMHSGIAAAFNIPAASAHRVVKGVGDAWKKMGDWAVKDAAKAKANTLARKKARAASSPKPVAPAAKDSLPTRLWSLFRGGDF
jgi:hypothetical protein